MKNRIYKTDAIKIQKKNKFGRLRAIVQSTEPKKREKKLRSSFFSLFLSLQGCFYPYRKQPNAKNYFVNYTKATFSLSQVKTSSSNKRVAK